MSDLPPHTEDEFVPREPIDLRELLRLHPRLLLAAMIVAVLMFPVGLFLAALGVKVLDLSGGAAHDTSMVVGIAGYLVSDFWGGGIVAALTRARAPHVAVAWTLARLTVLVLVVLAVPSLLAIAPIQLLLAAPAAWAGARAARKQAALRRHVASARTAGSDPAPTRSARASSPIDELRLDEPTDARRPARVVQ
ncbi:MAG: hypothetical protein KDC46_15795 [Thermoleophilia bacterium]|nr:hypothetical protein [Thermoleophilia bacterium]